MGVPKVDPDLCTGCGICEDICPDVFEVADDGLSHVIDPNACEDAGCCEEAADEGYHHRVRSPRARPRNTLGTFETWKSRPRAAFLLE
jgi:ferredoxin